MNHLNNQDKFEQKLKEQFGSFEAKPNEALWDNIAQNLPTDNFEKTLEFKLNSLKFEPNENVWLSIEKRMPILVQKNKRLIYLWTFLLLSFGVFVGFFINKIIDKSMSNEQLAISTEQKVPLTEQKASITLQIAASTEQKVPLTMQKAPITLQIAASTEQKVPLTMQKAPITLQIAASTEQKAPINSDLALNIKIPNNEVKLPNEIKNIVVPTKDSVKETAPPAKVDSFISSPKNKAVLAQQVNDKNYKGPSQKTEKLTIIAYGGLGYSFMRYAAENDKANSITNQKLREQTERTESEITGGFLIGYDLTKRFTISSGLTLANFKQTMHFSKETAKNPTGNFEENLIYFNDTITTGNTNSTTLKYSFTEIPLFITYKAIETQKFELAFQTGLGIGFVTGINTYIINTNNIGVYEVTNKDDFPAFKNTLFFSFQPQFTCNLNSPGVSVGLMPIIKTSLTNIVNDENWLKQYPYNLSFNLFLRKRF